ncbi:MAG: KOW domain-containing RNA-binding protein [Oscillospiraceae bacterium]|jgi:ribosomal protein L14E/L6E/L27E|nr:KOW domain-containing RNA-binding protein [Oscillospiraceae bacterium]
MELEIGSVVFSKAGHDKGLFMAVVEIQDEYVLVCDGRQRPVDRPKRKNPIHLMKTNAKLTSEDTKSNHGLREALKRFNQKSAATSTKGGL